jgi:hypothetical protein
VTSFIAIGPLTLQAPAGHQLVIGHAGLAERLVESSPDRTLYHSPSYVSFARAERAGGGELVTLLRDGHALVALPIYPEGPTSFTTGYSGALFPTGGDRALKRGVAALASLLAANPQLTGVAITQAVVSDGGIDDPRRCTIDALLACETKSGAVAPVFTRLLHLGSSAHRRARDPGYGRLDPAIGDEDLLQGYDGDLRNQIRQATRRAVAIEYAVLSAGADALLAEDVYRRYAPVHEESWARTGMTPHSVAHWLRLSRAVSTAGVDLVVLATVEGRAVAGVTCHLYGQHAIYWSGGSTAAGLGVRANPLCLHAAITLCRRMEVSSFELGRFVASEDDKGQRITHYKSQFGGRILRMPNLTIAKPPDGLRARAGALGRALAVRSPGAAALIRRARAWRRERPADG